MKDVINLDFTEISSFVYGIIEYAENRGISAYDKHGHFRNPDKFLNSLIWDAITDTDNTEFKDIHDAIAKAECSALDFTVSKPAEAAEYVEMVNHPAHYNQGKRECIAEMELLFGPEDVAGFCKCSAYKYRTRAGIKPGNSRDQDLAKADWYIDYLDDMIKRYTTQSEPAKIGFASNKNMEAVA